MVSLHGSIVTPAGGDRKSTRLNSSHGYISYAVFCLKKKKKSNGRHAKTNKNQRRRTGRALHIVHPVDTLGRHLRVTDVESYERLDVYGARRLTYTH